MSCGRTWEVEAVLDGRLHGSELASFERHVAACADCQAERQKLGDLHAALRAVPTPDRTVLEEERLRAKVLRTANERLLTPRSPRLPWIAAACVVAALAVFAVRHATRDTDSVGARPEPPRPSAPHDELPGMTAIEISPPIVEPSTSAPAPPRHASAAETFEHGVASFRGGNFGLADEQLAAFQHAAPGDPRCEDAAYLRAVARWRMGDRETATRLARDYLATYPTGLRRADAARIIDGTAQ